MGRPRGSPNKATANREKHYAEGGLLPLDYMLQTLRDTTKDHDKRMQAARDAAPYVHPRLTSIQGGDKPIEHIHEIRETFVRPGPAKP